MRPTAQPSASAAAAEPEKHLAGGLNTANPPARVLLQKLVNDLLKGVLLGAAGKPDLALCKTGQGRRREIRFTGCAEKDALKQVVDEFLK